MVSYIPQYVSSRMWRYEHSLNYEHRDCVSTLHNLEPRYVLRRCIISPLALFNVPLTALGL